MAEQSNSGRKSRESAYRIMIAIFFFCSLVSTSYLVSLKRSAAFPKSIGYEILQKIDIGMRVNEAKAIFPELSLKEAGLENYKIRQTYVSQANMMGKTGELALKFIEGRLSEAAFAFASEGSDTSAYFQALADRLTISLVKPTIESASQKMWRMPVKDKAFASSLRIKEDGQLEYAAFSFDDWEEYKSARFLGAPEYWPNDIAALFPESNLDVGKIESIKSSSLDCFNQGAIPLQKYTKKFDSGVGHLDLDIYNDGSYLLYGILPAGTEANGYTTYCVLASTPYGNMAYYVDASPENFVLRAYSSSYNPIVIGGIEVREPSQPSRLQAECVFTDKMIALKDGPHELTYKLSVGSSQMLADVKLTVEQK